MVGFDQTTILLRITNETEKKIDEFAKETGKEYHHYFHKISKLLKVLRVSLAKMNFLWSETKKQIDKYIEHPDEEDNKFFDQLSKLGHRDDRIIVIATKLADFIHGDDAANAFLQMVDRDLYNLLQSVVLEVVATMTAEGRALRAEKLRAVTRHREMLKEEEEELEKIVDYARDHEILRQKLVKEHGGRLDKLLTAYFKELPGSKKRLAAAAYKDTAFHKRAA